MKTYKAHYKDLTHDTDIEILNTEEEYRYDPLSFTLDGIRFKGTSLGDFGLADESQYEEARSKFNILKSGGFTLAGREIPYSYGLQGYSLDIDMPVTAVRKSDGSELEALIHVSFGFTDPDMDKVRCRTYCDDEQVYPDDAVVNEFSLCIEGEKFMSAHKTLCFEDALIDISRQVAERYYLKCCFTCQYSDYSPYGCDDFGTMMCFRCHKDECLKVNSKDEFFEHLEGKEFESRQETYLCGEYEPRRKSEGYRGFVDGV